MGDGSLFAFIVAKRAVGFASALLLITSTSFALPPPGAAPPQAHQSPPVQAPEAVPDGTRGAPRTERVVDSSSFASSTLPLIPPPPRFAFGVSGAFFREGAVALGPIVKYQHPFPNGSLLTEGIINVIGSGRIGSIALGAQPRTPRGSFSFAPALLIGLESLHVATGCHISTENCDTEEVVYSGTGPFTRLRLGWENRTFALSFHLDLALMSLKIKSAQNSTSRTTVVPAFGLEGSWWL